ncbi:MAG: carboxylating nicotinate-nucleotide diphosphorylase [Candidatus Aminicenantales bacterium]
MPVKIEDLDPLLKLALKEDIPEGDITSESIIEPDSFSEAVILAKESGISAGIEVAHRVFHLIDKTLVFRKRLEDGQYFAPGQVLTEIRGSSISILKGERTALNFLQRLSGIATATQKFVEALKGSKTVVLDTRKTTPGLRALEKYAVRVGGGRNHRFNLSEMVLIKDNHLRVVKSIATAVKRARKRVGPEAEIEVEVSSLEEAEEAIKSGANRVMLDNMDLEELKKVVPRLKGRVVLEVSGKVSLAEIRGLASLGVDYISIGSLTHSYKSIDISLEFLG